MLNFGRENSKSWKMLITTNELLKEKCLVNNFMPDEWRNTNLKVEEL